MASACTYGARRIWRDVLEAGFSCGLHKIECSMRAQALRARPRRRTAERRRRTFGFGDRADVLNRQFTADRAQPQMQIADFTYVWTAEGWLPCRRGDRSASFRAALSAGR